MLVAGLWVVFIAGALAVVVGWPGTEIGDDQEDG